MRDGERDHGKETAMADNTDELQKMYEVATDMVFSTRLRSQSIELIGKLGSHEALLALLELAANEQLSRDERLLALKQATNIVKNLK
jgi:hypothetical protein